MGNEGWRRREWRSKEAGKRVDGGGAKKWLHPLTSTSFPSPPPIPPAKPPYSSESQQSNPTSWAQLFSRQNTSTSPCFLHQLQRIQSSTSDEVFISPELLSKSRLEWSFSLIGKFLGKPPPLMSLRRDVALKWNPKGALQVVDMAAGFFVFKFSEEEDMMKVITGGPWSIKGLPLISFIGAPTFNLS
uniref:DUF4283 domain-containing protein n=1 Tax=Ananas comosus var. bracteatus TaxID=296719 RepID=A0A6V7PP78_ANACO|nr:unnamed protein product [Ananas comosus var. bracteatus]